MSDSKTTRRTRLSHNFWVGFFTIMGSLILVAVTLSLRKWDFLSNRTTYYALFANVKRLDIGAQVLAGGVKVGEVAALEAVSIEKYQVRVKLRINSKENLYANARVWVAAAPVIGDTTVNIDRGSGGNPLPAESVIRGEAATEIEDIARSVSESMNSITEMLRDPKTQDAIKTTLINLASATGKIDATFSMINTEMHPMIQDLHNTSKNLNDFLADARAITNRLGDNVDAARTDVHQTAQAWTQTARTLSEQIERTAQSLQRISGQLSGTVEENRAPLRETLKQMNDTSAALHDVAQQLQGGRGTLGKLLNDPAPFENLNRLLQQLSQTLGGGRNPAFPLANEAAMRKTTAPQAGSISPVEPAPPAATPGGRRAE